MCVSNTSNIHGARAYMCAIFVVRAFFVVVSVMCGSLMCACMKSRNARTHTHAHIVKKRVLCICLMF